jgi:hypothetical protein
MTVVGCGGVGSAAFSNRRAICRRARQEVKFAMTIQKNIVLVVLASLPWLGGCDVYQDIVGGLTAGDFEKISLNGFDPEDNAVDKNDYAWAIEYF